MASGMPACPAYTGTTSTTPVALSTRTTKGSTRFRGMRTTSAPARRQRGDPAGPRHAERQLHDATTLGAPVGIPVHAPPRSKASSCASPALMGASFGF